LCVCDFVLNSHLFSGDLSRKSFEAPLLSEEVERTGLFNLPVFLRGKIMRILKNATRGVALGCFALAGSGAAYAGGWDTMGLGSLDLLYAPERFVAEKSLPMWTGTLIIKLQGQLSVEIRVLLFLEQTHQERRRISGIIREQLSLG